jgi:hypothetical protein
VRGGVVAYNVHLANAPLWGIVSTNIPEEVHKSTIKVQGVDNFEICG